MVSISISFSISVPTMELSTIWEAASFTFDRFLRDKPLEITLTKPTIKTGISINLVLSFFFPLTFGLLFTL